MKSNRLRLECWTERSWCRLGGLNHRPQSREHVNEGGLSKTPHDVTTTCACDYRSNINLKHESNLMKTHNWLFALFAVLGAVANVIGDHHGEPIGLAGEWKVNVATPEGEGTLTWVIHKDGENLKGKGYDHDDNEERAFDRITTDGNKAAIEVDMDRNGKKVLIRIAVEQQSPNKLTGELKVTAEDGSVLMKAGVNCVRVHHYEGEWESVAILRNGNELKGVLKLSGNNDDLKGEVGRNATTEIDKASVKDGALHLEFDFEMNGRTRDCLIAAKPKGANTLAGTWTVRRPIKNKDLTGDWKAIRKSVKPESAWRFVHLFYFKFKEGVSDEEMAGLMKELASLKDEIPVLQDFVVGKNVAPRTHGYQYGQISVFAKPEDLEVYERHPEHQKLVKKIVPKLDQGVTMDFVPLISNNTENAGQKPLISKANSFTPSASDSSLTLRKMMSVNSCKNSQIRRNSSPSFESSWSARTWPETATASSTARSPSSTSQRASKSFKNTRSIESSCPRSCRTWKWESRWISFRSRISVRVSATPPMHANDR